MPGAWDKAGAAGTGAGRGRENGPREPARGERGWGRKTGKTKQTRPPRRELGRGHKKKVGEKRGARGGPLKRAAEIGKGRRTEEREG